MDIEAASAQVEEAVPSVSLPFPEAVWGRIIYALYVTVIPALAFWGMEVLKPEWQSGNFSDYVALLLTPEASLVFLLLLGYSVICYLLLLLAPTRFAQFFFVRFGIYTGALLAFQYSVLACLFLVKDSSVTLWGLLLLWASPIVYWFLHHWAVARWTARKVNIVLLVLVMVLLLAGIVIARQDAPLLVLMVPTVAAPFWSLLLALRATVWLFKNYETRFSLPGGLGLTAWLAAYFAAWRFDILKMYELYAALPKQPPDCYIATAAARGHVGLVRSWTVRCRDGKSMRVNRQLQQLKCAELALLAVNPRLHKPLRRIYDVIGKRLARWIQNPFLADAVYLLLKPWEWSAQFLLRIVVPDIDAISKTMYR